MRLTICQLAWRFFSLALILSWCAGRAELAAQDKPEAKILEIKRVLPPEGIAIPADVEKRLRGELGSASQRFEPLKKHELSADIEIFLKAVRYALDLHEFYTDKDFAKADTLLKEANERITQLAAGKHPWTTATGTVVRGYRSLIDGSAQPYGVVIPKNFDFKQKVPLYVWLHGRGDKATDLHFIVDRMTKPGEITPPNAIVVHAFGRQCVGFLNAGEVDVIDVMREGESQYNTDPNRRVLIGFSMGGAGAWHVGAHYAHLFRVVAPGAGFAETARYQKLNPEDYPPWYEQKLWGHNDAPAYVRNLFNTEVIAYSGELDRQIQAARVMEEAYQGEGKTLTHLIGPKTEHKYEPQTKAELLKRIDAVLQSATGEPPLSVSYQTRTLRYPTEHWVTVIRLEEQWQDSRVDAVRDGSSFQINTKNIAMFSIVVSRAGAPKEGALKFKIDGQQLEHSDRNGRDLEACAFLKISGKWQLQPAEKFFALVLSTVKQTASHGPIDDAFCNRFLVVTPSGKSKNARFQAWQEFELAHFRDRWKALMRGDLLEKKDSELTEAEARSSNLILWGDEDSNSIIRKVAATLPIKRSGGEWAVGNTKYNAETHVPVLIYPSPANNLKYIVLNSGLTFREGHDRTNSLQNPKLPDWAIIDITQPPDASAPGKVLNAGFFDEEWKLKPPPKK